MIQITEKIKNIENVGETVPCGFQMMFENGNTISVQFGFGNYCDNKTESKTSTQTAEVAIWNADGKWFDFGEDEVKGWCSADEVADYIIIAKENSF